MRAKNDGCVLHNDYLRNIETKRILITRNLHSGHSQIKLWRQSTEPPDRAWFDWCLRGHTPFDDDGIPMCDSKDVSHSAALRDFPSSNSLSNGRKRTQQNERENTYFLPEASFGLRVLSLPVSACLRVCVCGNHQFLRTTTHHLFKLGSPNLDHVCKRPCLRFLLFLGGNLQTFKVKFNLKLKIYPILSLSTPQLITIQARITKFEPDVRNT